MKLDTSPRLADPDGFFEAVMQAHRGLDAEASQRFDARLVLLLANHIGDEAVLREALALAVASARPRTTPRQGATPDRAASPAPEVPPVPPPA